ncbi:MAG: hypothetical protein R3B96_04160 [Pirellulaceae bacterium]
MSELMELSAICSSRRNIVVEGGGIALPLEMMMKLIVEALVRSANSTAMLSMSRRSDDRRSWATDERATKEPARARAMTRPVRIFRSASDMRGSPENLEPKELPLSPIPGRLRDVREKWKVRDLRAFLKKKQLN